MTDLPTTSALEALEPRLRELLERLPRAPGVYLLKNRQGRVIYVGKAKSLYARVRSYFTRSGDTRAFVGLLSRLLGDVETVVTHNEKEALLLENTLIKEHQPRFNVLLRDDKSFLVLRLDARQDFPRLEVRRRIVADGARYFGPYHSASACRQTLRVVNRYFQLRTCSDETMANRARPCLQHQIGRCPAPCVLPVERAQYREQVEEVTLFLRGREQELIAGLERRMQAAAERLDFEQAARLRDQLGAVRDTLQRQEVVAQDLLDRDVFALYREGDAVDVVVLNVRAGRLVGRRPLSFSNHELPDEELLSALINRYYDAGETVPHEVLLPLEPEDREAQQQWLAELAGRKVELRVPRRGFRRALLELAQRNAQSHFATRRARAADVAEALAKLQQRLRLERPPRHIECYDVSNLMGQHVVASLVVMHDGQPTPARYRHFKVAARGGDDFAGIYEVLARRLRRARDGDAGWELPDLMVIDGGKGQLAVALAALRDAALPPELGAPALVALAKARADADASGNERPDRVVLPGVKEPLRLRANTAELFLLSRLRDEAHRFAIGHHRRLRARQALRSGLDDIPGIGPRRRRELLRALGSLQAMRDASVAQLAAVRGMTQRAAENVVRYLARAGSEGAEVGESPRATAGPDAAERG
ncbi:MAG: excinuclease ABC subunit UvrC [Proteobacteria bacterium]|nr:excinuclease ABC subunit UvrC [Pseudomonadota bacterium]